VIQCPTSTEERSSIAEQFEKKWQFPHWCGALDGSMWQLHVLGTLAPCTETTIFSSPEHEVLSELL